MKVRCIEQETLVLFRRTQSKKVLVSDQSNWPQVDREKSKLEVDGKDAIVLVAIPGCRYVRKPQLRHQPQILSLYLFVNLASSKYQPFLRDRPVRMNKKTFSASELNCNCAGQSASADGK